jgi:SSS family solute:Na+ symporter
MRPVKLHRKGTGKASGTQGMQSGFSMTPLPSFAAPVATVESAPRRSRNLHPHSLRARLLLDLAVIVAYLVGVAVLGIALRGRQEGVQDYFLGSRRIAWPLILLSIVATETSTVTVLSVPGKSYAGDMTFLQLPIGYIVGRIGIAVLLMPVYFRNEAFTVYQILGTRFGSGVQRLNAAIFVATRTVADGLRLYLTALAVRELTQWSFETSIVVVGTATCVYTFFGGVRAVIWTDFLQFIVKMAGVIATGWVLLQKIPGGWDTIVQEGTAHHKFHIFEFAFDITSASTFWAGLLGGAFLTAATHGADQMMVQRYLCTDSIRHARLALVSSGVVILLQFVVFLLIGIGLFVFYQSEPPSVPNDEVFARFVIHEVPRGLRGVIVAAILSAAMGTLSGSLNSVASAAVTDLYRPLLRPVASDAHYLHVSRIATVFAGLLQMSVAYIGQSFPNRSTVDNVLAVAAFTTGITLGVLLLGMLSRRAGGSAALIAMVHGGVMVTCVWAFTPVAWPWYALYGSSVTLITGLAASSAVPQRRPSPQGSTNPTT